jgi:hypothetical protein
MPLETQKETTQDQEGKFELGEEFIKSGGKVLEWYKKNGKPKSPKEWLCGHGENGEIIDPQGMTRESLHYLNLEGKWEAGNPDKRLREQIALWRSDWNEPA